MIEEHTESAMREFASGLAFPEGPVAMRDGSVLVAEVASGKITCVKPDGRTLTIATPGGGPNGLAIGPDGALYVCNNGGSFEFHERGGLLVPGHAPESHRGGRIERVDLSTGIAEPLYEKCDGRHLIAPNDLVFDSSGGFWFTDYGVVTAEGRSHGALYYAKSDGSEIKRVLRELISPNGVGLSPDGMTVYFAETFTARLWSLPLIGPGQRNKLPGSAPGLFVGAYPGYAYFDSLGVQGDGGICVATLLAGEITTFLPGTNNIRRTKVADPLVTNICWGGEAMTTAYITASGTGKLLITDWPEPGLKLAYGT
ncbi:MAG TPA: SMP-30/gluconolactonase/LRE family protein [Rhizomicrobium sp.]